VFTSASGRNKVVIKELSYIVISSELSCDNLSISRINISCWLGFPIISFLKRSLLLKFTKQTYNRHNVIDTCICIVNWRSEYLFWETRTILGPKSTVGLLSRTFYSADVCDHTQREVYCSRYITSSKASDGTKLGHIVLCVCQLFVRYLLSRTESAWAQAKPKQVSCMQRNNIILCAKAAK